MGDARRTGVLTGAVVALKPLATAKTRFGDVDPMLRQRLVWAMAEDTLRAVVTAVDVTVLVTAEPTAADRLAAVGLRVTVLAEPLRSTGTSGSPRSPADPLNAAFAAGVRHLADRGCDLVACVMADLPTVTTAAVQTVVAAAEAAASPVIVRDVDDLGTTVLAGPTADVVPRFGGASAQRHRDHGAIDLVELGRLTEALVAARVDVDDQESLRRALRIGLGARTREVLADAAIPAGDRPGSLLSCGG